MPGIEGSGTAKALDREIKREEAPTGSLLGSEPTEEGRERKGGGGGVRAAAT